jgi:peptidoglycan/LPS O-acetylase OafA/YrhL
MNLSAFQDHDFIKLIIDKPLFFNIELLILLLLAFLIFRRKSTAQFLDIHFTDELKGIAIILIVLHHLSRHTLQNPAQLSLYYNAGFIGVALFLFLSGYGLTKSAQKKGLDNFFTKRFFRIYLPFILISFLEIYINHRLNHVSYTFSKLTPIFFGQSTDRNFWYIQYLFYWYIAFYLLYPLKIDRKYKSILFLLPSLVGLFFFTIGNSFSSLFSFPFGVIIALYGDSLTFYYKKIKKNQQVLVVYLLVVSMISYLFHILANNLPYFSSPVNTTILLSYSLITLVSLLIIMKKNFFKIIPVCAIFLYTYSSVYFLPSVSTYLTLSLSSVFAILAFIAGLLILNKDKISPIISFIGKISFEIYLFHGMFMYSYDFILYRGHLEYTFPIYFIALVAVSFVFHQLLDKLMRPLAL